MFPLLPNHRDFQTSAFDYNTSDIKIAAMGFNLQNKHSRGVRVQLLLSRLRLIRRLSLDEFSVTVTRSEECADWRSCSHMLVLRHLAGCTCVCVCVILTKREQRSYRRKWSLYLFRANTNARWRRKRLFEMGVRGCLYDVCEIVVSSDIFLPQNVKIFRRIQV